MDTHTLEKYAELTLKVGVNLQEGQRLCIGRPPGFHTPIQAAPLVEVLASKAYQMGARYVDVLWIDDVIYRTRFEQAPPDSFNEYATWQPGAFRESVEREDAIIKIVGRDPDLFVGIDQDRRSTYLATLAKAYKDVNELWGQEPLNWCVISYPLVEWAKRVFPDGPDESQVKMLWDEILKACYLNEADPVAYWQDHLKQLDMRAGYLQERHYRSLEFHGPGTNLKIGLPEDNIWVGGGFTSRSGIDYAVNMPTEEVFTTPHRLKVDGTVTSTKPVMYSGQMIDEFSLTFREGAVVELDAKTGKEHLQKLLDIDEGSRRLGEVAMVPHSSPISQSGILFYNLLFDENASSHLALGGAYREALRGGAGLTDDEFQSEGGNVSFNHIDFMIGSAEMDIDGVIEDGTSEPIMRSGEWAFDLL
ncbi:MAG: aminopeptidase [Anaerolineales bacterium]|nr:aminopeptidase [Anaerolineales bacterium]